jgi:molybdopterin-guanine dinucleotide biosynthesis protein A
MTTNIAGAILSGGQNKRMGGKNKAFIEIEGISLIQRALDIFDQIFDEIFIVTNSPADYRLYEKDYCIISDKIKDVGPLGGIHSALSSTSKKGVFFIACDMPFLHNDLINEQIAVFNQRSVEALIPKIGDSIEPLHGIYAATLKSKIDSYLKKKCGYSIKGFLPTINSAFFRLKDNEFNRKIFKNLNSPCDFKKAALNESKI